LSTTKGTVRQQTSIFTCKRNTLRNTLVDDVYTHLCKTINVRFTRTVVASFYSVIKQTENTVAVVLIILCSVDTTLRSDTVRTSGTILKAKRLYVIAKLTQRSSC